MKISTRTKYLLWILLITLNTLLRWPVTGHEIGWDSYNIHILANSISHFGRANYWENPLSIIGLYPLSYASSVPFTLSGISQLSGINMELVTLLFSTALGLFSIFPMYLVAGEISNNDFFKFVTTFVYSISEGILFLTTWTVSTRGLLVVLLPLFMYFLIKYRTSLKYKMLTLVMFIFLVSTHNLFYYTAPMIMGLIVVEVSYKFRNKIKSEIKYPYYMYIILLICSLIMFLIPLLSRSLWSEDPELVRQLINSGSRYMVLLALFNHYTRYIGPLIFFNISGYFYLLLKNSKSFQETYFLVSVASLTPLLYTPTYTKWFILPFAFLLIGKGIENIMKLYSPDRRYIVYLITILLIISTCFSGYYQFIHFKPNDSRSMQESTYVGGLWIKKHIDGNLFYDNGLVALRTFAISEVPTLFGDSIGLSYGFYASVNDLNITKNSPLSVHYYLDGPVVKTLGTAYIEGDINQLHMLTYNSTRAINFTNKYNLSYVIDYIYEDSIFINSVSQDKSKIYDSGEISLWDLGSD